MSRYADVIVDVIIVGAGPAGSMAAAVLARHGVKTLLLDREPFPRPKPCGDVVPLGCLIELSEIGLRASDLKRFDIDTILIHDSHSAKRFGLAQQGELSTCIVSRTEFDHALYRHALACGAESRIVNVKGPILDGDNRVIGISATQGNRQAQYFSHIVIGADGATSSIARGLGSCHRLDDQWAVAIRGYVDTCVDLDRTIELAFLDHLQPGYAWFFPMDTRRANVGVGMRSDFYRRGKCSLGHLLSDYLAMPENASRIGGRTGNNQAQELQSWSIPFFSFEKQRVFDGALLAGDAGGFVHPITAAGIYPAIITGKCAAQAALRALEHGDFSQSGLSHYDTLWRDALAADYKPAVAANKLATVFPHLVSAALLISPASAESSAGDGEPLPFSLGKF